MTTTRSDQNPTYIASYRGTAAVTAQAGALLGLLLLLPPPEQHGPCSPHRKEPVAVDFDVRGLIPDRLCLKSVGMCFLGMSGSAICLILNPENAGRAVKLFSSATQRQNP